MSNECAVCFATDINYLLPTLVAASGLRAFVPTHKADIYVFLVDQAARTQELNLFLEPYGIRIVPMDSAIYGRSSKDNFKHSAISPATLARFFMEDYLPASCQRLVYLDGDIWIRRDPSALIEAVVPEGKFAAAEDMMSFRYSRITPRGRPLIPYFKGLGIDPKQGYFNAGVFATSRRTWKALATEAYSFYENNIAICKYYDQSALNAVMGDRRLRLSLKWNFQTPFRMLNIESRLVPNIYHFHSHPKPWMGACEPWMEIYTQYQSAIMPFDALKLPLKKIDAEAIAEHNKMNWRKNTLRRLPFVAEMAGMHLGIASYEKKAWL